MPFRIIFWYFPRATQSGGQGKVKVCPSGDNVCAAAGAAATPIMRSSRAASDLNRVMTRLREDPDADVRRESGREIALSRRRPHRSLDDAGNDLAAARQR